MKSLAKGVAVSVAALFMSACGFDHYPEYDKVQKDTLYQGVTAQDLDDTQGTIKGAIIYAAARYNSGSDTIAEVHVGSVRACFTQMTDAASVNTGAYRVDCIGPAGNIVARFATESAGYQSFKDPAPGQKKGVREVHQELNSRQLL